MRKFIFIIAFVFSLFVNQCSLVIAQTGWFWQNPLPQANNLTSTYFVNSNTGYAVGEVGTILKTTDGGDNWVIQQSGIRINLRRVYFINSNTGFALGDTSRLFMTTNGGSNWNFQNLSGNIELNGIYFINQNTGFLGGYNNSTTLGNIFKTTNSGINWSINYISNGGHHFNTIQFLNQNIGFAGSSGGIFYSSNSGENWTNLRFLLTDEFHFIDTVTALLVYGSVYKTTNCGINFSTVYPSSYMISLSTVNNNVAYVVGFNGNIIKTTNSGNNWIVQQSGTSNHLKSVFFIDSLKGWVVGNNGTILKTTNGGTNWQNITQGSVQNYFGCDFLNSLTGWVSGENTIAKTTNGGDNWIEQWGNPNGLFNSICFINNNTGWSLNTASNSIYKSTNGGSNWILASTIDFYYAFSYNLYQIRFTNELTGWIAGHVHINFFGGDMGIICKTTNGGYNWTYEQGSALYYYDVKFINQNTGWLVGSGNTILKTTNMGLNWVPQQGTYTSSMHFNSVSPVNENTVYLLGHSNINYNSNAYVSKTTNGGLNWTSLLESNLTGFNSIKFYNENVGAISGTGGNLYATSNGGINWYLQSIPTNWNLNELFMANENTFWAVGNNGTILKTNIGVVSRVKTIRENIPGTFILFQNYPNPFNPVTKIKFDIPSEGKSQRAKVKLVIYNIIGKEIQTLVNEQLQSGTYEVTFDGGNLPSGVYFYQLRTGDYTETKKMLLIK
jgi:photosystem II stability/assembly factor-like uncharacterized protein